MKEKLTSLNLYIVNAEWWNSILIVKVGMMVLNKSGNGWPWIF